MIEAPDIKSGAFSTKCLFTFAKKDDIITYT